MRAQALTVLLVLTFWHGRTSAQMVTGAGTTMTVDEGTSVRLNGSLIWLLTAGASVINDGSIVLGPETSLNEATGAAITGGGTERTTVLLPSPVSMLDIGGLGAILSTNGPLGVTDVVRGHLPYTDYSGHSSIARWIRVGPEINSGLNATFSLRYDPYELASVPELSQILHIRAQDNIWWTLPSAVNTTSHLVTTTGSDSLGLFTTFDQDLPNALSGRRSSSAFRIGLENDGSPWLFVPEGQNVSELEVIDAMGRSVRSNRTRLASGWHAISITGVASGVYRLRVNRNTTLSLPCP